MLRMSLKLHEMRFMDPLFEESRLNCMAIIDDEIRKVVYRVKSEACIPLSKHVQSLELKWVLGKRITYPHYFSQYSYIGFRVC